MKASHVAVKEGEEGKGRRVLGCVPDAANGVPRFRPPLRTAVVILITVLEEHSLFLDLYSDLRRREPRHGGDQGGEPLCRAVHSNGALLQRVLHRTNYLRIVSSGRRDNRQGTHGRPRVALARCELDYGSASWVRLFPLITVRGRSQMTSAKFSGFLPPPRQHCGQMKGTIH